MGVVSGLTAKHAELNLKITFSAYFPNLSYSFKPRNLVPVCSIFFFFYYFYYYYY
jgi:hypothetical protein